MKVLCLVLFIGVALAKPNVNPHLSDERIAEINSKANTWKAGRNFDATTSMKSLKSLVGVLPPKETKRKLKEVVHEDDGEIPESFDAREAWPNCTSINTLRDQSDCGSCWAFGAVEAMSDRICIHSNQERQTQVSAEHLNSCCYDCGYGCEGGWPIEAWYFWQEQGIVTGGLYGTTDGCQAYSMAPCEHHTEGDRPSCDDFNGGDIFSTPACRSTCDADVDLTFLSELTYGESPFGFRGVENIQRELMKNGPLEVDFDVYDDFLNYKSGVYQVTAGSYPVGAHAVKLVGWGVENDVPYWLIANSWNSDWGDNGYFKIIRGTNECEIESDVIGAIPVLD